MKLKFVAIPAKGAAETRYANSNEGDEVLKCLDLNGYATLFGFVGVGVRNPARHADARALFLHRHIHGHRWGKLPWRKMLRYSGKLGKKAEKVTGGEQNMDLINNIVEKYGYKIPVEKSKIIYRPSIP